MKTLLIAGLVLGLSAHAQTYAPNDGSTEAGNPGTGVSSSAPVTTDPAVKESVDRANTSVTPVPEDTDDLTLQGKTQTGPYRTPSKRQSQEAKEEELDYRTNPKVDHTDENASGNP